MEAAVTAGVSAALRNIGPHLKPRPFGLVLRSKGQVQGVFKTRNIVKRATGGVIGGAIQK
eukprot:3801793-Pyramimonas_sp.AAC.1